VLRGEPGVGKTALLEYVAERASYCRVARSAGIESEMELAFAGLYQLCGPLLDGLGRLPEPQADALRMAFGMIAGREPDIFLVALAVLGLLSEAAELQPVVCIVDDAQWLDRASAQVLAFVARRVFADSVAMVFAQREPTLAPALDGLPELVVRGLSDEAAGALLDTSIPGGLDPQVRARILGEACGNPLALLELTRGLSPAELAGGFSTSPAGPLSTRIEESFHRRLQSLPTEAQALVHLAAAEPVGDSALLWRAASLLGISTDAAAPAEAAGLLDLTTGVRFTHPLMRSAAYRAATAPDRRAAHAALAEATDAEADPDRRAWHNAHAAVGPDEDVASELERSAARARSRGGAAAAAAFLRRATELTPDPARRGARALDAVRAALDAAAPDEATKLLSDATASPLDDLQQAAAVRLRAGIAFAQRRGNDGPPLLLDAARRLERLDPALARETYLDALEAAIFAGRLGRGATLHDVAEAARRAPPASHSPRIVDLLVDGLAVRFTDGYVAAVDPLRRFLDAALVEAGDTSLDLQTMWMAIRVASDLWDDAAWEELVVRQLQFARESGLRVLPAAVTYRAGAHLHAGELGAAAALTEESASLTESVGGARFFYTTLVLDALRGEGDQLRGHLEWGRVDASMRGEGRALTWADYTTALLNNGLGTYQAALAAAQDACAYDDIGITNWALVELVEAAARHGQSDVARAGLERLTHRTRASGTSWACGIEARSRALLGQGGSTEDLYQEALDHLTRTRMRVHLARAHLVYGEWLRRENRRVDAREQLRTAHELLTRFGADGWAERARRELMATGEKVRKRTNVTADASESLTAQEAQIARLARDGHTNPEIGSQLFISPRTVEYHLRKVFTKLDIGSRRELRTVRQLGDAP